MAYFRCSRHTSASAITAAITLSVAGVGVWFTRENSIGLWTLIATGLATGFMVGVITGARAGSLILVRISRGKRLAYQKLSVERQMVKTRSARLDGEIIKATINGRKESAEKVRRERAARMRAEGEVKVMSACIKALEDQLREVQSKD